ncbi:hypothetical protein ACFQE1_00425 [Halobium palmae]|uniref:Uncharacterized protein n=1 Tax=Halobium palmae TaxID=1776492 RepID=A0ABD5RUP0_9EURY
MGEKEYYTPESILRAAAHRQQVYRLFGHHRADVDSDVPEKQLREVSDEELDELENELEQESSSSSLSYLEAQFRKAAETAPPVTDGIQESWRDEIDRGARAAIDTFGWPTIRDYIRLISDGYTKRSAGLECFSDTDSAPSEVWGIIVGDAVDYYMRALVGDDDSDRDWESTDLWKGIQDTKNDNFVRPDQAVEGEPRYGGYNKDEELENAEIDPDRELRGEDEKE